MARPLRIEYPGALYHVMNRGANRCRTFLDEREDRNLFQTILGRVCRLHGIVVHAYSLMGNHYHLVIETPHANLSRALQYLDSVYTLKFNKRHHRDGALFRGRFKSILIQKESYFLEAIRYVHLNGTKACLFFNPTLDWFGSHRGYLFPKERPGWLTTSFVLSFFAGKKDDPRLLFDRYVLQGVPKDLENTLNRKRWPAILGVKSLVEEIRKNYLGAESEEREQPQRSEIERKARPPAGRIMEGIAAVFQRESKIAAGATDHARRWITMVLLREMGGLTYKEIGKELGGLSYSGAARFIQRNN